MEEVSTECFDADGENLEEFKDTATETIESHIESNREEARRMGHVGEKSLDEVLGSDNIDKLQIRAKPLENPRVTLWLHDCPMWANDAWNEKIYPFGINAYNGKVRVTFDVRPR